MLVAIDIGNTTISVGALKGQRVVEKRSIESDGADSRLRTDIKKTLTRLKRKYPRIKAAVLCSVVPKSLKLVQQAVRQHLKVQPLVIGRNIKVPIKNNYRNTRQVGQDRLVCAYAVKQLYGKPAIIVDFGTAITFDVVSNRGSYEGGIIVPGIRLSAESLSKKTALLPSISAIKGPKSLIGKDTQGSILSGLFNGYGAMCCGLIDRITKSLKGRPKVIVTGGHTHLMRKFIAKKITKIDKDLVFKGMAILYAELP